MHRTRHVRVWKAGVTIGPALITLFLIALIAMQHARTFQWAHEVQRSYRVTTALDRLLARLIDAETAERGFILTGDERYLEPFRGVEADVPAALADLRQVTSDARQKAALNTLPGLVQRRLALNSEHIHTRRTSGFSAADAALRNGRGKATMDSIRAVVGGMGQRQSVLLAARREQMRRTGTRTEWLLIGGMVGSLFVGVGTHRLLRRFTAAEETRSRELAESNHQLQEQAVELEIQAEELSAQAMELEQTSQALAESERRFRTLIENSSDIITIVDAQGRVRYQSPTITRVMGYDPATSVGSAGLETVHDDDRAAMDALLGELTGGTRGPVSTTVRCRNSAGEWRLLEATATNLSDDEAIGGIVVNSRDVTERHRAETEVHAQRAYLRSVIDSSPSLIFAKDHEGRITMANAAAGRAFGAPADRLVGLGESELAEVAPEVARFSESERAVLDTGRPVLVPEETVTDPHTGDVRWLQTTKVRLTPPGVGAPHVLVVATDITERKRAEMALARKEDELRQAQKLEAVGQLAGGVAHDFNNILTAVRGFAQVLMMDAEKGSPVHQDLLEIDRAGERGAILARQLLAFSRKQVMHPRRLDLNEVARGTHRMMGRLMGDDVELAMELSPEPVPVLADPGQLEQVLVNLVVNARDAMPDGGRVTVATRNVAGGDETLARDLYLPPGERGVLLSVSDTGHGMDAATRERIFEPFFTTKPQGRGTGLGLSTVYGIVVQSGGGITVRSTPGQGATFYILLPRADVVDDSPYLAHDTAAAAGATATVLLVEDEGPVRSSVRRMLERHGYTVLEAPDPHEALRICAAYAGEVNLLLTDVVMPQMKGPELARRVTRLRPGVRVVFMSGYSSGAEALGAPEELPQILLEKPFSVDELLGTLAAALA